MASAPYRYGSVLRFFPMKLGKCSKIQAGGMIVIPFSVLTFVLVFFKKKVQNEKILWRRGVP